MKARRRETQASERRKIREIAFLLASTPAPGEGGSGAGRCGGRDGTDPTEYAAGSRRFAEALRANVALVNLNGPAGHDVGGEVRVDGRLAGLAKLPSQGGIGQYAVQRVGQGSRVVRRHQQTT